MTRPQRRTPPGMARFERTRDEELFMQCIRPRPKPGTVRADILDALLAGQGITPLDAWELFGTSRLAAHVHALRRMCWPIITEHETVSCRGSRTATVARYRMNGQR